jgi:hypothetical protein
MPEGLTENLATNKLAHPLLDQLVCAEKRPEIEFLTFHEQEKSHNEHLEPVNDSTEFGKI